jgi:hypothetical protein
MRITHCPACGCEKHLPYPHPLYRICFNCNSLYQFVGIKNISDYYDEIVPDFSHQKGSYRIYLRIMKKFLDLGYYNLIDIGSGDGTFLDVATPFVFQAYALDVSPIAQTILSDKGYLLTKPIKNITPKIITALQVIEHIKNPQVFINNLHLSNHDWLVLTSPAPDSPTAKRLHPTGDWRSLSPSHHLCLYSKQGLEILADTCNLSLVHYEYTWSGCHGLIDNTKNNIINFIKWSIKKLLGLPNPLPFFYGKTLSLPY